MENLLVCLLWLTAVPSADAGPSINQNANDSRRYGIEVAGVRVGTLTTTRQPQTGGQTLYTLISDVQVNFLVYKLKIYYKVDNLFRGDQLMQSTVRTHTNRGDYLSRTEWKTDHYEIVADQYKYSRRATEPDRIDYAVTNLYYAEPTNRNRTYAEYFGDYFNLTPVPGKPGTYRARLADRQDEYVYENGQLTTVIKKNSLKNFVIRLLP